MSKMTLKAQIEEVATLNGWSNQSTLTALDWLRCHTASQDTELERRKHREEQTITLYEAFRGEVQTVAILFRALVDAVEAKRIPRIPETAIIRLAEYLELVSAPDKQG